MRRLLLALPPLLEASALISLPQIPREGVNDKGYAYRTDGRAGIIEFKEP